MKTQDLSRLGYTEWTRLVFDHPVSPEDQKEWYWADDWAAEDREALLALATRLFLDFSAATAPYSHEQIDQGIWFLLGDCINLPAILAEPSVPWSGRAACIRSMARVYSEYVASLPAEVPLETCFHMWFDLVGDAVSPLPRGPDRELLVGAVFGTLVEILALDEPRCQRAALHGLGHLAHPDRATVVEAWLRRHRKGFTDRELAWVEQCRDGTVM